MHETKNIAVLRMLLPKITQPRIALLIPKVGEDAVDDKMEMGVLVPVSRRFVVLYHIAPFTNL